MNNEPVAWMQVHYKDDRPTKFSKVQTWEDDIPLYTHPAKTLTDEEILQLWKEFDDNDADNWFIEIARAILRKAQQP